MKNEWLMRYFEKHISFTFTVHGMPTFSGIAIYNHCSSDRHLTLKSRDYGFRCWLEVDLQNGFIIPNAVLEVVRDGLYVKRYTFTDLETSGHWSTYVPKPQHISTTSHKPEWNLTILCPPEIKQDLKEFRAIL